MDERIIDVQNEEIEEETEQKKPNVFVRVWNWTKEHKGIVIAAGAITAFGAYVVAKLVGGDSPADCEVPFDEATSVVEDVTEVVEDVTTEI